MKQFSEEEIRRAVEKVLEFDSDKNRDIVSGLVSDVLAELSRPKLKPGCPVLVGNSVGRAEQYDIKSCTLTPLVRTDRILKWAREWLPTRGDCWPPERYFADRIREETEE